jgi:hypothetical protein
MKGGTTLHFVTDGKLEFLLGKNAPKDEALELIKRDAEESTDEYGQ